MNPTGRVVVLIDMDCFYCQVEEQLQPALKGKPVAVVQYNTWQGGGVIAVNYAARNQGVTRHIRGNEAKKKCPSIQLVKVPEVRGKADLTKYREAGNRVAAVLAMFTPLLQRASVDEAYLDITEQVEKRITNSLDDLIIDNMRNTFVVGSETDDFLNNVRTNRAFSEENLKLAVGALITEEIRRKIFVETGYECSAGIAHNKILAKLVCSLHKPNKQTILPQEGVELLFESTPIRKITSLGGKFGQMLSDSFNITKMIELKNLTEKQLLEKCDRKSATWLYNIARGIDFEPVTPKLISKSIACCKQFSGKAALTNLKSIDHWLKELAAEMVERLRIDLKANNREAKQLVVSFTYEGNEREATSSKSHALAVYEVDHIARIASETIKRNCERSNGSFCMRFMGLSASHFEDVKNVRKITSFFNKVDGGTVTENMKISRDEHNRSIESADSYKGMKENDEDGGIYFQTTQELAEDSTDLIFYEESDVNIEEIPEQQVMPIADENVEESFFMNYFKRNLQEQRTEPDDKHLLQLSGNHKTSLCVRESNNIEKNSDTNLCESHTDRPSSTKPELEKEGGIKRFVQLFQVDSNSSEFTEPCPQCNKRIRLDEIDSHKDYHVAKKLHLELNSINTNRTNSAVKKRQTGKNSMKKSKQNEKSLKKAQQNLISFFKQS